MEHSIIEYLYYDDDMRKEVESNVEFEDAERRINRIAEKLKATFTDEQNELFEKYVDNVDEEYLTATKLYFKKGIKIGVRIVAEGMFD